MNLRDHLENAVDDTTADLDRLTRDSRRQGLKLRRYRQAWSVVGGTTAAAVALTVGFLALSGPGSSTEVVDTPSAAESTPAPTPAAAPAPRTVPLDGRGTVAALRAAIEDQATGTFSAFAGQQGYETYGQLDFTPSDGSGVGVVGVNVQPGSILDGAPFDCSQAWMVDCSVRRLPGGDRIRTYQDVPVPTAQGDGVRVVAELLSRDRALRVVAGATNGYDLPSNQWDVTRPEPVLTVAQLSDIVSQPWWGFQIPREYAESGAELSPYTDLDAGNAGRIDGKGPSPSPGAPTPTAAPTS